MEKEFNLSEKIPCGKKIGLQKWICGSYSFVKHRQLLCPVCRKIKAEKDKIAGKDLT